MSRFFGVAFSMVLFVVGTLAVAQDEDRYSTDNDALTVVNQAPGAPENSIFAGFENNESVSMFNGNLLVSHPSSPSYPLDGGGSIGLIRSYNSKNVYHTKALYEDLPGGGTLNWWMRDVFQGTSWIGAGWTMHFGRLFRRPSLENSNTYNLDDLFFEDSQGTQHGLTDEHAGALVLRHQELPNQYVTEYACNGGSFYCGDGCCDELMPITGGICGNRLAQGCTCDCSPTQVLDDTAHHRIVYPDGTAYRLEQLVPEESSGVQG